MGNGIFGARHVKKAHRPRLTDEIASEARALKTTHPTATAIAAVLSEKHGLDIKAHQVRVAIKNGGQEVKLGRPSKASPAQETEISKLLIELRNAKLVQQIMKEKHGIDLSYVSLWKRAQKEATELVGQKPPRPRKPKNTKKGPQPT